MIWAKYIIELAFSIALFINAALYIPQILRILQKKDSQELSFTTFAGFWCIQFIITLHGLITSDYLLAFGCMLSLLTCGTVVILILLYRTPKKL